jgi:ABC-2 type transport system ATP-binding protein
MDALTIEAVHKTYPSAWRKPAKEALRGVSLGIPEGETFGFIGPNGAGKSTLIKILVGSLRPTAGEVRMFGLDPLEPASRKGLGFVPENPSMPEHLTPYEILLMGLRLHGHGRAEGEREYCYGWLERFDLARVADSPVRGFSKGMTQRTALAHALAIKPRLLILDEPLSGLDPVGRRDVVDILDDYRKQGGTLFFSSHVLHDVERIADRFGLISDGRLLTIRSPRDVISDRADIYVLRFRSDSPVLTSEEVRPGLHQIETSASELSAHIDAVLRAGGVLQDVSPKHSLESVFFAAIGKPAGISA